MLLPFGANCLMNSAATPDHPFLRRDAHSLGIDDAQVRRWLRHGEIRRVFRGVYVPSRLEDTLELRAACAGLVLPPHCVFVERSAAWLHGIDLHAPDERFTVPELEVVSFRHKNAVRRAGIYGATRDLTSRDVTHRGNVGLTTPLRTALDLACLRGEPPALAALDAFMRAFAITHEDLERELPRYRRRRGVVQLRRLIPMASPLAESPGESWLRATLLAHGFPNPDLQIEFWDDGRLVARADLGYRHLRIAVEYFGEEFHGPDDEEHDMARIRWLEERRWHVVVVRKDGFAGPARDAWMNELAREIARRSRPRGKRRYPRGQPFTV